MDINLILFCCSWNMKPQYVTSILLFATIPSLSAQDRFISYKSTIIIRCQIIVGFPLLFSLGASISLPFWGSGRWGG